MKRQLADRARQAEALEKQQQLEQQKLDLLRCHDNDLSDVVSNAKEFQIERKSRTIQFPSSTDPIHLTSETNAANVSGNVVNYAPTTPKTGTNTDMSRNVDATTTSISSSTTSSSLSDAIIKRDTPSSLQDAVVKQNHPPSPSLSNEDLQLQRPTKIPKLSNSVRNSPLNHDLHPSLSLSAATERENSNGTHAVATLNSETLQPSSRRLSLHSHSTTMNDSIATAHTNYDDNASSQQSAFYLKHQNRALATELKSYQYTLSEVLKERTARRSHCFDIFQSVQQLINIWNTIESTIASVNDANHRSKIANDKSNNCTNSFEKDTVHLEIGYGIASTGTDDSIEWTSALYKALKDLGNCTIPFESDSLQGATSQNINGNKMTDSDNVGTSLYTTQGDSDNNTNYHYAEASVVNISARAKILQEWLQQILEKHQLQNSNDIIMNENTDRTESTAIQELLTRCATLESQIAELVTCRTDLIQRERRLRRNIYRMASNLLSPEQLVSSAMMRPEDAMSNHNNDVDDIETAVHLEKQELLRLQKEHQELLETINATKSLQSLCVLKQGDVGVHTDAPHVSKLLSKRIDEYQINIAQLEESILILNQSIQQVRQPLRYCIIVCSIYFLSGLSFWYIHCLRAS